MDMDVSMSYSLIAVSSRACMGGSNRIAKSQSIAISITTSQSIAINIAKSQSIAKTIAKSQKYCRMYWKMWKYWNKYCKLSRSEKPFLRFIILNWILIGDNNFYIIYLSLTYLHFFVIDSLWWNKLFPYIICWIQKLCLLMICLMNIIKWY